MLLHTGSFLIHEYDGKLVPLIHKKSKSNQQLVAF